MTKQNPGIIKLNSAKIMALALTCGFFLMTGCSKPPEEQTGPARKAVRDSNSTNATTPMLTNPASSSKSVFTAGKGARDPFFPKSARFAEKSPVPGKVNPVSLDITALLQEGFQGVIQEGSQRIASINNIILEANMTAEIPVKFNGQDIKVSVRCIQVKPNGVVLMLPGQNKPVTITRKPKSNP